MLTTVLVVVAVAAAALLVTGLPDIKRYRRIRKM
jgi:hypothetical protein